MGKDTAQRKRKPREKVTLIKTWPNLKLLIANLVESINYLIKVKLNWQVLFKFKQRTFRKKIRFKKSINKQRSSLTNSQTIIICHTKKF